MTDNPAQPTVPLSNPLPPVHRLIGWLLLVWGIGTLLHAVAVGIDLAFPTPDTPTFASHFHGTRLWWVPLKYLLALAQCTAGVALLRGVGWGRRATSIMLVVTPVYIIAFLLTHYIPLLPDNSIILLVCAILLVGYLSSTAVTIALLNVPRAPRWLTFPHLPPAVAYINVYVVVLCISLMIGSSAAVIHALASHPPDSEIIASLPEYLHSDLPVIHFFAILVLAFSIGFGISVIRTLAKYSRGSQRLMTVFLMIGFAILVIAMGTKPFLLSNRLSSRELSIRIRQLIISDMPDFPRPLPPIAYEYHSVLWIYANTIAEGLRAVIAALYLNLLLRTLIQHPPPDILGEPAPPTPVPPAG